MYVLFVRCFSSGAIIYFCINQFRILVEGDKVYAATLNQSNIEANNNKFYIIQLLQHDTTVDYILFTRWGRVGVTGQMA